MLVTPKAFVGHELPGRESAKAVSATAPLQRMRSRVNDMISFTQRLAYTRRSNGQAFKPTRGPRVLPRFCLRFT